MINPLGSIRDALAYLDDGRRWGKGAFGAGAEPHCLLGALREVNACRFVPLIEEVVAEQYSDRLHWRPVGLIPNFNDHPDTVFADIERVMEKAALKLDEEVR